MGAADRSQAPQKGVPIERDWAQPSAAVRDTLEGVATVRPARRDQNRGWMSRVRCFLGTSGPGFRAHLEQASPLGKRTQSPEMIHRNYRRVCSKATQRHIADMFLSPVVFALRTRPLR